VTKTARVPRAHRLSGVDTGRLVAIVLVVAQHISGPLAQAGDAAPPSVWLFGLTVQSIARFSVPLFVMLSGALMLRPSDESAADFYVRRFHRVALPALVWILIYYAFTYLYLGHTFQADEVVLGLLRGRPYNHLYFIYLILGLYAFTPILRTAIRSLTVAQFNLLVGLTVGWVMVDTAIRAAVGLTWTNSALTWSVAFIGYYLLGYRLLGKRLSRGETWAAIGLWLLAAAATIALLVVVDGTPFERYSAVLSSVFSPFVFVMAAASFVLMPPLEWWIRERSARLGRALPLLAGLTFGVYLMHEIFVAALYREYGLSVALEAPILWTVLSTLGVTAVSFFLVWALSLSRVTSWLFGMRLRRRGRDGEPDNSKPEPELVDPKGSSPHELAPVVPAHQGLSATQWYWVLGATLIMLAPVVVVVASLQWEKSLPVAKVVVFKQGSTSFGTPVPPAQSRPAAAVDRDDDSDDPASAPGFCSLGLRGELIVEMQGGIVDGPDDDLLVVEKTWGVSKVAERARVSVSDDMKTWVYVGAADNAAASETSPNTENRFDLGAVGLSSARYVRLVDATVPSGTENVNGLDVSLITALHPSE